ncbi:MAG: acyl-CoA dehydratase activase [Chloroflexota bacterium]|nr:acyl-CoA dehydratase activase [Chloroflexota bacterium]
MFDTRHKVGMIFLGVDVGSITTKFALIDESAQLIDSLYIPTHGNPTSRIQDGIAWVRNRVSHRSIYVGTTGSARYLAGKILGADVVKNEITCQSIGTLHYIPDAHTIIEIGGQDSKIILIRDEIAVDFGMNTICAAGTGSFLDQQALRLSISIQEMGQRALQSQHPVKIAGRCTVFAESDMINKQQMGHTVDDILYGLCQALVINYLNNIGHGKEILPPIVFQGGVAFNKGMVRAFEEALGTRVIIPPHHEVMGAIGAALLAHEDQAIRGNTTHFRGIDRIIQASYYTSSFECRSCPNHCDIARLWLDDEFIACWGGHCDLWESMSQIHQNQLQVGQLVKKL